jgi:hypothetical protein
MKGNNPMVYGIGDTVWVHLHSGVSKGEIVSKQKRGDTLCIDFGDQLRLADANPKKVFRTKKEAVLALAKEKQQEAARLLQESATLFSEVGLMVDEPAT